MTTRTQTLKFTLGGVLCCCSLGCGFLGAQDQEFTYNNDIAPLILRNCISCHREGGTAPFPLTTFQNVRKHGKEISAVLESGDMPPWLPDREISRFRHERGLEEAEAGRIIQWIASGMKEGDSANPPEVPEFPGGWQLGEPDLVVTLPDPVEMPAEGEEVFRNFVIPGLPPEADAVRFVRAIEFEPGAPAGSIVRATVREDSTGIGRRLDALDESPGFPGIVGGAVPGSHVISWSPGQAPEPFRDKLGWQLSPGADLILQLHLAPNDQAASIQPRIGLYFSDQAPAAELKTIHLGVAGLTIPAGTKKFRVTDQMPLEVAVKVYSILPHAHRRATRFASWATLPDGSKQPLMLIPEWDYRWRQEYQFAEPVSLPAGSVIQMEVFYDNSDLPGRPSKDVRWGPLSENEMADVWLTIVPENSEGIEKLKGTVFFNDLQRQLIGYQAILASDPTNFEANSQIGHILVNQEKNREAIPFLSAAIKVRPEDARSWHNRGMARFFLGDPKGAKLNFRKALDLDPNYAASHNALATAYSISGELEESIPHFRKYLEFRPEDVEIWENFAVILSRLDRLDEAEKEYEKILEQSPDLPSVLTKYGHLLAHQGKVEEGLEILKKAEKLDPGSLLIRFRMAQVLMEAERFKKAREMVNSILKIDPGQEAALNALEEIEKAIKDAAAPTDSPAAAKPSDR